MGGTLSGKAWVKFLNYREYIVGPVKYIDFNRITNTLTSWLVFLYFMQVAIYIYNVTSKKIFNCGILLVKMLQIDPIFSTIHMFWLLMGYSHTKNYTVTHNQFIICKH